MTIDELRKQKLPCRLVAKPEAKVLFRDILIFQIGNRHILFRDNNGDSKVDTWDGVLRLYNLGLYELPSKGSV